MLDEKSGKALSKEDAIKYAAEYDIPFVEGKEIVDYYKKRAEEVKIRV